MIAAMWGKWSRSALVGVAVLALAVAGACGGDDDGGASGSGSDGDGNLITEPGFENGGSSWKARGGPPTISADQTKSGGSSALLQMRDTAESPTTQSYSVFQDITTGEVPEFLSFEYFVGHWVKGTRLQYIEATVVVTGKDAQLPECAGEPCPNFQLRYLLAGVETDPVAVLNAGFIVVSSDEPVEGEWVHFEAPVADDFAELWGQLPDEVESIRLLVDVRYDNREAEEAPLEADVYIDDVYLGAP